MFFITRKIRIYFRTLYYFIRFSKSERHKIIASELEKCFIDVNNFLRCCNIDYWLSFGTLLGYYRENNIILGDYDVDFSTFEENFHTILNQRHVLPDGYKLLNTSERNGGPKLFVRNRNNWEIDIYFYQKIDENRTRVYLREPSIPDSTIFNIPTIIPTQEINFLGQKTRAPNNIEEMLKIAYGYLGSDSKKDKKTGYWRKNSE